MNINTLINNIGAGDAATSNNTFNSVMQDKMNVALNIKKQEVASSMYGAETPTIQEPEADADV